MSALPRTGLRCVVVLMAFSWGHAVLGVAGHVPPPAALPKPLPNSVVEAWQKAGAEVGWMHVDDTGRLQTVARDENPLYYDLIRTFQAKTGIPVILNTSFNENEPIVCKPDEAIDCFGRTKMDVLAIGPFLACKSETKAES